MIHYAVIEQEHITKSGEQSEIYDRDVTGHACVYKRTYRHSQEFDKCVEDACVALSGVADDKPKVLVISAHGHPFISGRTLVISLLSFPPWGFPSMN